MRTAPARLSASLESKQSNKASTDVLSVGHDR
jgi:hypothetical protein